MRPILAILFSWRSRRRCGPTTPAPAARLRGTIEQVSGDSVDHPHPRRTASDGADRAGHQDRRASLLSLDDVKAGDFIGTAAVKESDGHLRALEVTVLPEAMRGAGEGQHPWDTGPDSSMTNATVAEVASNPDGRTLQLKYKGGEATVDVPANTPIVTPIPGDRSLLIIGKAVVAFARQGADGRLTAAYVTVEKDGVKPPM